MDADVYACIRQARIWLPRIRRFGKMTGQNNSEQLDFFRLVSVDEEANETGIDLPLAIQVRRERTRSDRSRPPARAPHSPSRRRCWSLPRRMRTRCGRAVLARRLASDPWCAIHLWQRRAGWHALPSARQHRW